MLGTEVACSPVQVGGLRAGEAKYLGQVPSA